jgi:hypothetical protein
VTVTPTATATATATTTPTPPHPMLPPHPTPRSNNAAQTPFGGFSKSANAPKCLLRLLPFRAEIARFNQRATAGEFSKPPTRPRAN